ncbi:LamG-like jellyroll fold domain-containing protein [Candidatus Albibeggiatoa sp. nov. BB20]|uniref:LamG-like jellyroll fold domain-containing protein n=1 Tax=Candidatus Albibeggiatoa sp. nov. BB20 TaxID=3162723 RepID=UPI0033657983
MSLELSSNSSDFIEIIIGGNTISNQLQDILDVPKLPALYMTHNTINGSIPDLTQLTDLQKIDISSNTGLCRSPNIDYGKWTDSIQEYPVCSPEFSCSNITEIPQSECEVLVNIYDDLGGDNWTNNAGWKQTNNPCTSWYNLGCKNGHVTDIALSSNNLTGTIPDLTPLTELETLPIGGNPNITGALPNIGSLTKLYHFSINGVGIIGTLSDSILGATSLRELALINTSLTGNLPDFSQLTNLTQLNLGQSKFTGKIPTLPTGLTLLNLADNKLCHEAGNVQYPHLNDFPVCNLEFGAVLTYPMTGNANDTSGNANNGVVDGATLTTDRHGNVENAYNFDGIDDRINLNPSNNLVFDDMSVSFWIQTTDTGEPKHFISAANATDSNEFLLRHSNGQIAILLQKETHIFNNANINDGTWHLLSIIRSGSEIQLFIDGQLIETWTNAPTEIIKIDTGGLWLGADQDCVGGCWKGFKHFEGNLDEVIFHNRALSTTEIQNIYAEQTTIQTGCNGALQLDGTLCNGLLAAYTLENNANDVSGNGYDGTQHGSLNYVGGINGQAVSFDANSNNYISVAHDRALNFTGSYSFVFWVNHNNTEGDNNFETLISKGRDCDDSYIFDHNGQRFVAGLPTGTCTKIAIQTVTTNNEWHFVTGVMDTDTTPYKMKYYLDTQLIATKNVANATVSNTYPLLFGRHYRHADGSGGYEYPATAKLDELLIYNRALTAEEIQQLYQRVPPFDCQTVTSIPTTECDALISLYTDTNGSQWPRQANWLLDKDPCIWQGMSCQSGHVTEMDLHNNGLSGVLPSLAALTQLQQLELQQNGLLGEISESIGNLTELNLLNLGYNQLSGKIPTSIGSLTKLTQLDLQQNQLVGNVPANLANTVANLTLSSNRLSGTLPEQLCQLSLNTLLLTDNNVTGEIPACLQNIATLDVSDNGTLCKTAEMTQTAFENYAICGMAKEVCGQVTEIPNDQCQSLVALYEKTNGAGWTSNTGWLENNQPCTWYGVSCNDGSISALNLSNNNLQGTLPQELAVLTDMGVLSLNANKLQGEMPDLSPLSNLERLQLGNNGLSGSIPDLDTLVSLEYLDISDNPNITGNIPKLDGLNQLENVFLDNTGLTGELPDLSGVPNLHNIRVNETDTLCRSVDVDYSGFSQFTSYNVCTNSIFTLFKRGVGSGSILSSDNNIICHSDCDNASYNYPENVVITLTATANAGSTFKEWEGQCLSDSNVVEVSMTESKNCYATFDLERTKNSFLLEAMKLGDGRGSLSVYYNDEMVDNCGDGCSSKMFNRFETGSTVTLNLNIAAGSILEYWGGACEGLSGNSIELTMDKSKSCLAHLTLAPTPPAQMVTLSVDFNNSTGNGTIYSLGIECGADCEEYIEVGRTINLKAEPDALSRFVQWAGSPQCHQRKEAFLPIVVSADTTCYALFESVMDVAAENSTEELYEEGYLSNGEVLADEYPPEINEEILNMAYRLAESTLLQIDEHLALNEAWPNQFEGKERYIPPPERFSVESVKILSETVIELEDRTLNVSGNFVRVDVILENKEGDDELLPILIYYGDEPQPQEITLRSSSSERSTRRRRGRSYGCHPRRGRHR